MIIIKKIIIKRKTNIKSISEEQNKITYRANKFENKQIVQQTTK